MWPKTRDISHFCSGTYNQIDATLDGMLLYITIRYGPLSAERHLMKDGALIVFTGDKGGVGKSTLAVLMTEWFLSQSKKVHLVDADPNQTSKTWAEKCEALGYKVNVPEAPVTIVDTAGTSGSSLNPYIRRAGIIVVPFQPHVADLETVVGWFLSINPELQRRVVFVPNRLTPTKEQRDGLQELRTILKDEGRGHL